MPFPRLGIGGDESPDLARESLRRLFDLPGELRVHSGHGPVTTLAAELRRNPFLGFLRIERGMVRA